MILYRPTGLEELYRIHESEMRTFPRRLPDQHTFYPFTDVIYAAQMALDWNTNRGEGAGFVVRFVVEDEHLAKFRRRPVGNAGHHELWIPREELWVINENMASTIEVVAAYFHDEYRGLVPDRHRLKGLDARRQFLALAELTKNPDEPMNLMDEVEQNQAAVFLNYLYWEQADFSAEGITAEKRDKILFEIRCAWETEWLELGLVTTEKPAGPWWL
jgi:hypothetical protein